MAATPTLAKAKERLRKFALAFPQSKEDFPWGHSAFKIGGKTFLFTYLEGNRLSLSVKLPDSGRHALSLPFAKPTEYGLGKHGWVTCVFFGQDAVPLDMIEEWIGESFRAVAPKKFLNQIDGEKVEDIPPISKVKKRKIKKSQTK